MTNWTTTDIPDQNGRVAVITGANSGLGFHTAKALAARGAHVVLAVRNLDKGREAASAITASTPDANVTLQKLDLGSLASVRSAADELTTSYDRIDLLINNAGLMGPPKGTTADGFESQIGTNHLGHAALTWLLMPAITGRVVTVSSIAHRGGGFDVDDLNFERRPYRPSAAYSASKLANLLFTTELDRRLKAAGSAVLSVAAHPGMTDTELTGNSVKARVGTGPIGRAVLTATRLGNRLITQSLAKGTLPQLYAATAPDVRGGEYFGPSGPGEVFGAPGRAKPRSVVSNPDIARKLWVRTAELTGVSPDPA